MKKALETPLQALREDQPTFWQVTQVKSAVVSTCLELVILFLNLMPYAVPFFDVLFILNLSGR